MIIVTSAILCGGSEKRLWPLSRTGFPKQFLYLTCDESLFQQAAKRLTTLGLEQLLDWEHAKDYVRTQRMLQQDQLEDFVITTGVQYSVRQFIEWSAAELGIKLRFEGQGVDEVAIIDSIEGDKAPALKSELGWTPEITVQQMCTEMVANDLEQTKQRVLLKANGYQVNVRVE